MHDPDYRWDDIRVFLAVWRSGSLLGAGKALGVNGSTVGRRLDAFEESLGAQLFERTTEGVVATLAAERLHPWAEAVEQAHVGFTQALSGLETEPVGVVRLTGPPGLIDHFIAPIVSELRDSFPGLAVVLDSSVGYADLTRGEADIALRATRPERGDLIVRKLGPFRSRVIAARGRFAGVPFDALPWIQWGDDLLHLPDARWIATHVPDDAIVLRTSSFAAQIEATRRGRVVMLAAEPVAELDGLWALPSTGPADDDLPVQPLYLVGHQALRRVPRVAVMWDFLVERMTRLDPEGESPGEGC